MTLREFILRENLLTYAEQYPSLLRIWNRVKIENAVPFRNGYQFTSGKTCYRVTVKDTSVYSAERANEKTQYLFFHIPCRTRTEERTYPRSAAWIGTLLADKANS